MTRSGILPWVVDLVTGGLAGALAAGIVAVNLVIYLGVEGGYEAGLDDVFEHSVMLGVVVLAVFVAGPILGVTFSRKRRRQRDRSAVDAGMGDQGHDRESS